MKATEVFVKSEGLEDEEAINGISEMIMDSFVNPTEEQGLDTIVDALRTYAVQTSDTMPNISELADTIADKIEAYSIRSENPVQLVEDKTNGFDAENQGQSIPDEINYDDIATSPESENSSYYDEISKTGDGVTFSDRVSAMKDWAEKALDKINEKNIQKENEQKRNGGER